MNSLALILYLVLIIIAYGSLWICFRLYSRLRFKYLKSLFLSMLFYFIFCFLDIVVVQFSHAIFGCTETATFTLNTIQLILNLIALPFLILSVYFFIHTIYGILNRAVPPKWSLLYFFAFMLIILYYGIEVDQFAESRGGMSITSPNQIRMAIKTILWLCQLVLLSMLYPNKAKNQAVSLQTSLRPFTIVYFLLISLHGLLVHLTTNEFILCNIYPVMEILLPVLPILLLNNAIIHKPAFQNNHTPTETLQQIIQKYRITKREGEIIQLILEGKSNRDIEKQLFISYDTVKTHVYKIYKKIGIKNRWQLINRVQQSQQETETRPN